MWRNHNGLVEKCHEKAICNLSVTMYCHYWRHIRWMHLAGMSSHSDNSSIIANARRTPIVQFLTSGVINIVPLIRFNHNE